MRDWNVVVTVREKGFARAFEILGKFGSLGKTDYYNVLVMQADDVHQLMDGLMELLTVDPEALSFLARLAPVSQTFHFQDVEEFETRAGDAVLQWVSELAGKRFHVRIHRRGFKGRLSSMEEEGRLAQILLEALDKGGAPGQITFEDPDAVVAVETVGTRAGLSLWTRGEIRRFPFLRVN